MSDDKSKILVEEEYLPEDDTPEPEPVTTAPPPEPEKKKTGRSIRSEAQLKALERGRQRKIELAEQTRKAKILEEAKKLEKEKEIVKQQVKEPEPAPVPVVSKPIPIPEPPKPRLEKRDGRFYLL